jgi:N-acetylglucosamine kinase-like BadF-type ATPase
MTYILGLDQGSSNTRAAVMDANGNVLSYRRTVGNYYPDVGIDNAMDTVMDVANGALADANITAGDLSVVVGGITGIDYEGDELVVAGALRKRFGDKEIIACNDCEIGYFSGSVKEVGAVVCGGTGLNVAIYAPGGKKFVMGDYIKHSLQGGGGVARRTIETVIEADIGVWPETKLTKLFCDFAGVDSVLKVMQKYIADEKFGRKIITLAPAIIDIADEGDEVALSVLTTYTDELCACVIGAMKKMRILERGCDIVLAGSVLKGRVNLLAQMVAKKLLQSAKNANVVNAKYEPVVGACIMGMALKAGGFGEGMAANVAATAGNFGLLRVGPDL